MIHATSHTLFFAANMASPPPRTLGLLLAAAVSIPVLHSYPDAACDHLIYCKGGNGTLLHTVQVNRYTDVPIYL